LAGSVFRWISIYQIALTSCRTTEDGLPYWREELIRAIEAAPGPHIAWDETNAYTKLIEAGITGYPDIFRVWIRTREVNVLVFWDKAVRSALSTVAEISETSGPQRLAMGLAIGMVPSCGSAYDGELVQFLNPIVLYEKAMGHGSWPADISMEGILSTFRRTESHAPLDNKDVAYWISELRSESVEQRTVAAKRLSERDHVSTHLVNILTNALEDIESLVRIYAALAIGRTGASNAVPGLVKAMAAPQEPGVRGFVVLGLARLGPVALDAIPILVRRFKMPECSESEEIVEALARIGPGTSEVVNVLIEAIGDQRRLTSLVAVRELGDMRQGAKRAIPALTAALNGQDRVLRWAAEIALRKIDPNFR